MCRQFARAANDAVRVRLDRIAASGRFELNDEYGEKANTELLHRVEEELPRAPALIEQIATLSARSELARFHREVIRNFTQTLWKLLGEQHGTDVGVPKRIHALDLLYTARLPPKELAKHIDEVIILINSTGVAVGLGR